MGSCSKKAFKGGGWYVFLLKKLMVFFQICMKKEPVRHQGGRKLWQMALHQGYYWPTMERDAQDFAKKCQECQWQEDEIHTSHQNLHPIVAPYPFHS